MTAASILPVRPPAPRWPLSLCAITRQTTSGPYQNPHRTGKAMCWSPSSPARETPGTLRICWPSRWMPTSMRSRRRSPILPPIWIIQIPAAAPKWSSATPPHAPLSPAMWTIWRTMRSSSVGHFLRTVQYMPVCFAPCSCVCSRLISPSVSSWHKQDNTSICQSGEHIQHRTPYNS